MEEIIVLRRALVALMEILGSCAMCDLGEGETVQIDKTIKIC